MATHGFAGHSGLGQLAKSLADGALSLAKWSNTSSAATARPAATAINDGLTGASTKTLATIVLTQRPGKRD